MTATWVSPALHQGKTDAEKWSSPNELMNSDWLKMSLEKEKWKNSEWFASSHNRKWRLIGMWILIGGKYYKNKLEISPYFILLSLSLTFRSFCLSLFILFPWSCLSFLPLSIFLPLLSSSFYLYPFLFVSRPFSIHFFLFSFLFFTSPS